MTDSSIYDSVYVTDAVELSPEQTRRVLALKESRSLLVTARGAFSTSDVNSDRLIRVATYIIGNESQAQQ